MARRALLFLGGSSVALAALALRCAVDEPAPVSARWPERPDAAPAPSASSVVYAIDALEFAPAYGKEAHGWDLDGKTSVVASTDVCTPHLGTPSRVQEDGVRGGLVGIDNSFEANVTPLLRWAGKTTDLNGLFTSAIRDGAFTLQIELRGITTERVSSVGLSTQTFASGRFEGGVPKFTADETWPVRADLVADGGLPFDSLLKFGEGWVADGTFVSGAGEVVIAGVFNGEAFDLRLRAARIVGTATGDALRGTLSGVIDVEELVAEFRRLLALGSTTFCGHVSDGIAEQVRQTADILRDGTNERGVPCDGISFAVGFSARRIGSPVGSTASEVRQPDCPDPFAGITCRAASDCGDAGTPTCCVTGSLSACTLETGSTKCASLPSSCGYYESAAGCSGTVVTRTCGQKSDCANTFSPFCCDIGAGLKACVANDIAAKLTCLP